MMMTKVTFEVTSEADPLLVVSTVEDSVPNHDRVPLEQVGNGKFKGELELPLDTWLLLSWIFVGQKGAKYSIQLDPRARIRLSRGSNPIESSISTQRHEGAGAVWFGVVKS